MRYIGNKQKLMSFIHHSMLQKCDSLHDKVVCDLFAGSCSVSRYLKTHCSHIITNDLEQYSFVLANNYIKNNSENDRKDLVEHLNNLEPVIGEITKNFSPYESCGRMFFTPTNAQKIDSIRIEAEKYKNDDNLYYFILCSLLESADMFSNTTGVYGAYLKKFGARPSQDFVLTAFNNEVGATGECYKEDANVLIEKLSGDILYLDPPYNSRQYGANYHILNYIADYDFKIKTNLNKQTGNIEESKTGLGEYNKSLYSQKSNAKKALEQLIEKSSGFDKVFMSYNDEGIISCHDIKQIFEKYGDYDLHEKEYKRYKSNSKKQKQKTTIEYLHILERKR